MDQGLVDPLERHARERPDKPAILIDEGVDRVSYRALHERSKAVAHWLIGLGLGAGDCVALVIENGARFFEIAWGARRAGLYFVPVNVHLKADEVAHILNDCGARLVITTSQLASVCAAAITSSDWRGMVALADAAEHRALPHAITIRHDGQGSLPERPVGRDFLYSSGTSGRPKGVRRPLIPWAQRLDELPDAAVWRRSYRFDTDSVYLSPAPLYHAAPLRFTMRVLETGGTIVVKRRFDAAQALALVALHRCTHSQWVPTMMIRLLALPAEERQRHDLSSMRVAIHAAAPCPIDVKRAIIDWWGPILIEYYGGSEGVGITAIDSHEWLVRPGSVGRATLGRIHIKDASGQGLPIGEQGLITFSGGPRFEYHNDPVKTAAAYDAEGCATYGDIGHVDAEGYLYLSGRRTDLILSGGVNIYPQEIENLLATYPGIADVAVIGVPHPEFGEEVKAVVELVEPERANPALAESIIAHCRAHLAHFKCPRSVAFVSRLPREPNGKLYKRLLAGR